MVKDELKQYCSICIVNVVLFEILSLEQGGHNDVLGIIESFWNFIQTLKRIFPVVAMEIC